MLVIDTIKNCELFSNFQKNHLQRMADICRSDNFMAHEVIFNEGDEAKEMYILSEGKVSLEMNVCPVPGRPAIPTAVEVVGNGEILGWSALVQPYVYTLTAHCMTPSSVLGINGEMLRKLMGQDPELGYEIMDHLARIISDRLSHTRMRLTSGIGLLMGEVKLNSR